MHKFLTFLFLICGTISIEAKTQVLVSIVPQKFLVETIGGPHVSVAVIVPPGANSHNYEPSPRQMLLVTPGTIWFRLGESFETKMIPSMQSLLRIIDQSEGLDLIHGGCGCCNVRDAHDPHIWLSPVLIKKLSRQVAHVLCERDPEHRDFFLDHLEKLEVECDQLDMECRALLKDTKQRYILVSHPAFGYFCRDYGLEQLSIEMEGREPTPRYTIDLINKARGLNIHTVFLQRQHNPKGGERIAKELNAETIFVDPYLENMIENLRMLANLFAKK